MILTKDQTKWNYDAIMEMIEGPLLNPKRLEEAIKASKWGRRMMSFFHPFSHRFSDMAKTKVSIFGLSNSHELMPHSRILDGPV